MTVESGGNGTTTGSFEMINTIDQPTESVSTPGSDYIFFFIYYFISIFFTLFFFVYHTIADFLIYYGSNFCNNWIYFIEPVVAKEEPEKIKKWREEQAQRLEEKGNFKNLCLKSSKINWVWVKKKLF